MIAVLTVLVALPLGYLCRTRTTAFLAFVAAFAHLYAFQTALLVMEWVNGSTSAFERSDATQLLGVTWGYFTFTTLIYVAGLGLIHAGHLLRARRERTSAGVDLAAT